MVRLAIVVAVLGSPFGVGWAAVWCGIAVSGNKNTTLLLRSHRCVYLNWATTTTTNLCIQVDEEGCGCSRDLASTERTKAYTLSCPKLLMSRNAVYNADVRQSNDQYGAPTGPLTPITVHERELLCQMLLDNHNERKLPHNCGKFEHICIALIGSYLVCV